MFGGNGMRGFNHGFGYSHGIMNGYGGWMGLLPLALHLIFFLVIILFAVVLLRRHSSKVRIFQKQNDPALRILRERYAQGEIDTEEYNQRKQDLTN
jgi:Predicted membrane protein